MAKKADGPRFPEPPWAYAPSEVAEWLASVGGRKQQGSSFGRRQPKVRGFVGRLPITRRARLLGRLERLSFRKTGESRRSTADFRGTWRNMVVHVRIRAGEELEVRTMFRPALSLRRALKFLVEIGLHPRTGKWL